MILPGLSRIEITPVVKQVNSETGALDRLQVLLGNYRISIDIGAIEGCDDAGKIFKLVHGLFRLLSHHFNRPNHSLSFRSTQPAT